MTPEQPRTGHPQPNRNGWQWSVVPSMIDETVSLICVDVVNKAYVHKTWDDDIAQSVAQFDPTTFWHYMHSTVKAMTYDLDARIEEA